MVCFTHLYKIGTRSCRLDKGEHTWLKGTGVLGGVVGWAGYVDPWYCKEQGGVSFDLMW